MASPIIDNRMNTRNRDFIATAIFPDVYKRTLVQHFYLVATLLYTM